MKTKALCLSCLLAAFWAAHPANAAVIMTLEQSGPNVVATASGTIDTADLAPVAPVSGAVIISGNGFLTEGTGVSTLFQSVSGPSSFGSGSETSASTSTSDSMGIYGALGGIALPQGYTSGSPLSSTATWNNTTLSALGVTPGTYVWTWGSGAHADSLTLYAGVPVPTSVPEPAPAALLTLGAAALALLKRRKK